MEALDAAHQTALRASPHIGDIITAIFVAAWLCRRALTDAANAAATVAALDALDLSAGWNASDAAAAQAMGTIAFGQATLPVQVAVDWQPARHPYGGRGSA